MKLILTICISLFFIIADCCSQRIPSIPQLKLTENSLLIDFNKIKPDLPKLVNSKELSYNVLERFHNVFFHQKNDTIAYYDYLLKSRLRGSAFKVESTSYSVFKVLKIYCELAKNGNEEIEKVLLSFFSERFLSSKNKCINSSFLENPYLFSGISLEDLELLNMLPPSNKKVSILFNLGSKLSKVDSLKTNKPYCCNIHSNFWMMKISQSLLMNFLINEKIKNIIYFNGDNYLRLVTDVDDIAKSDGISFEEANEQLGTKLFHKINKLRGNSLELKCRSEWKNFAIPSLRFY